MIRYPRSLPSRWGARRKGWRVECQVSRSLTCLFERHVNLANQDTSFARFHPPPPRDIELLKAFRAWRRCPVVFSWTISGVSWSSRCSFCCCCCCCCTLLLLRCKESSCLVAKRLDHRHGPRAFVGLERGMRRSWPTNRWNQHLRMSLESCLANRQKGLCAVYLQGNVLKRRSPVSIRLWWNAVQLGTADA